MNKAIRIILIVPVTLLILGLLFIFSIPFINDAIAESVAQGLERLPLPNDTETVESLSIAGTVVGNGNGMQYFGVILVKSSLSLDELREHYGRCAGREVYVCEQRGNRIEVLDSPITFESELTDGEKYYAVYSFGSAPYPFVQFDLRGH